MTEKSRPAGPDPFWRCPTCGTPNPSRSYLTQCLGCGAPASTEAVADAPPSTATTSRTKSRRRWDRALVIASWIYAALILTSLGLINWIGEDWWGVTVLLFTPRWLFLGPVILLALASGFARRPSHWLLQATIGVVVAGPLMGFSFSPERLWSRPVEGTPLRILTYNVGASPIDGKGLVRLIEREKIDLICFQERFEANPEVEAYLAANRWHRDSSRFLASRYPIVAQPARMKDTTIPGDRYGARLSLARIRVAEGQELLLSSVHMPTIRPGLYRFLDGDPKGVDYHVKWWRGELGRVVSHLCQSGTVPILIGGDFNMPSDDSSMATLQSVFRFGFEDSGLGYGYTRPSRYPWFRIDHIMASPECRFLRCWVGPDLGSDHLPLIAEVVLPRSMPLALSKPR